MAQGRDELVRELLDFTREAAQRQPLADVMAELHERARDLGGMTAPQLRGKALTGLIDAWHQAVTTMTAEEIADEFSREELALLLKGAQEMKRLQSIAGRKSK
jgi:hypothetical protein